MDESIDNTTDGSLSALSSGKKRRSSIPRGFERGESAARYRRDYWRVYLRTAPVLRATVEAQTETTWQSARPHLLINVNLYRQSLLLVVDIKTLKTSVECECLSNYSLLTDSLFLLVIRIAAPSDLTTYYHNKGKGIAILSTSLIGIKIVDESVIFSIVSIFIDCNFWNVTYCRMQVGSTKRLFEMYSDIKKANSVGCLIIQIAFQTKRQIYSQYNRIIMTLK